MVTSLPLGGLMHPYPHSNIDKYPNPIQTGRPQPEGPRRKVWPPLVAFLLVAAVAVVAVIAGYRHLRADVERSAAAEAAAAALAPTESECVQVLVSYDLWLKDDPHLTLDQTRALTVETASAALDGAKEFEVSLAILPERKDGQELRAAVRDYVAAMGELRVALSKGWPTDPLAEAAWTARSAVYDQRDSFNQRFCA